MNSTNPSSTSNIIPTNESLPQSQSFPQINVKNEEKQKSINEDSITNQPTNNDFVTDTKISPKKSVTDQTRGKSSFVHITQRQSDKKYNINEGDKKDIKMKQQGPSKIISHRNSLPTTTGSNTLHNRTSSAPILGKEETKGSGTSLFSRPKTEKSAEQQAKEDKAKKIKEEKDKAKQKQKEENDKKKKKLN